MNFSLHSSATIIFFGIFLGHCPVERWLIFQVSVLQQTAALFSSLFFFLQRHSFPVFVNCEASTKKLLPVLHCQERVLMCNVRLSPNTTCGVKGSRDIFFQQRISSHYMRQVYEVCPWSLWCTPFLEMYYIGEYSPTHRCIFTARKTPLVVAGHVNVYRENFRGNLHA